MLSSFSPCLSPLGKEHMDRYDYHAFRCVDKEKIYTPRRKGYIRTVLYALVFVSLIIFV